MQLTIDINKNDIYKILDQLDIDEKINIVKKLENETFALRLKKLRDDIPKSDITDDEILEEVKKVRCK